MLVIGRRLGDVLYIGPDVAVMVVADERNRLRLGIIAPREVSVMRSELLPADDPRHKLVSPHRRPVLQPEAPK